MALEQDMAFLMLLTGFCAGIALGAYQDKHLKPVYDTVFSKSATLWQDKVLAGLQKPAES